MTEKPTKVEEKEEVANNIPAENYGNIEDSKRTNFTLPKEKVEKYTAALKKAKDFDVQIFKMYATPKAGKPDNQKAMEHNIFLNKGMNVQDKLILNSWFNVLEAVYLKENQESFGQGIDEFYKIFGKASYSDLSKKIKYPIFAPELWKDINKLLEFLNSEVYNISIEDGNPIKQCMRISFVDAYFSSIMFQKYFWKAFAEELQDPNDTTKALNVVFRYLNPLFAFFTVEEIQKFPKITLSRNESGCLQLVI